MCVSLSRVIAEVRVDDEFVVISAEVFGDSAGMCGLAEILVRKTNGKGLDSDPNWHAPSERQSSTNQPHRLIERRAEHH